MKDFAKQLINFEVGSELITSSHQIKQSGITGSKNCLHIATERNDREMARFILDKIPNTSKHLDCLKLETAVDIQGQRPRLFSCLHLAAYYGNTELVRLFLDKGMDVNHLNGKKDTALLWAARWGHDETVTVLLQRNADPEIKNDKGSTALYWAIRYQFPSTVSLLLTKGHANPNTSRKLGLVAPIIIASAYGNTDIVAELLKHPNIDVNTKIRGGDTAIHNASREGWLKVVKLLIKAGARFDESDDLGNTPLLLAARNDHVDVAKHLIKLSADVNHKNHDGYDVWFYAVNTERNSLLKALVSGKFSKVAQKRNPLCIAASVGNCDKIQLLLSMNFDPNSTDDEGNTFLHHAAMCDQANVIDTFHTSGALHSKNEMGNTPLHLACMKGLTKAIHSLLNCKAKADVKNKKGETPLHVAAYSANISPETANALVQYTIKTHAWESLHDKDLDGNNCLHIAGKFASPEVLWEFRFVRMNDKDKDGLLPLHEAVRPGQEEALEMMLDIYESRNRDASINESSYVSRETVLHLAADEGHARCVKRLIDLGADISAKDVNGDTTLHRLIKAIVFDEKHKSRHIEVFDAILDNIVKWWCLRTSQPLPARANDVADVTYRRNAVLYVINDVVNNKGLSVLNQAFKSGCPEVLSRLILMPDVTMFEDSSNIYSFDISGMTPRTNNELKGCWKSQVNPVEDKLSEEADDTSVSGLELLITNKASYAAEILDLPPIRKIEQYYTSMVAWTFAVLILLHIIYMSVFTYLSVDLLKKLRTDESDINSSDTQTILMYIFVPVEPAIIIIYNIYAVIRYCVTGDVSRKSKLSRKHGAQLVLHLIGSYLFQAVCVGFAALVFAWIGLFTQRYFYQDYVLAAAICVGWLLTIAFTRGIRAIHYFYRMLLSMILRDVVRFIIVYLFVLMAFSFTFHVLFQVSGDISETYESPFDTMFLTFNMMIGMGELFDDDFDAGMSAVGRTTTYAKVIYLLYMILGTIVLLNLLIAMMNDSYSHILAQKQVTWRIDSVSMGVEIESSFPLSRIFSSVKIQQGGK